MSPAIERVSFGQLGMITPVIVDWGAGNYEVTATELEPVSQVTVQRAALRRGERVVDLACGTGNAALLAALAGTSVVGIDAAPRLLEMGRDRAAAEGVEVEFRLGDLLDLPLPDHSFDVVVSVFGLIFASEPGNCLYEIRRVLRPGGRLLFTAWIPAGPLDAMMRALSATVSRITGEVAPTRFAWSDAGAVQPLAARAGLQLDRTTAEQLEIRDASIEDYVLAGREHPMALAVWPVIERAGAEAEVHEAMLQALRPANEDPDAFLAYTPYVVHELRAI